MIKENSADFIVIGGGIAGASLAAELSREASVLLLERESQPGYHSTGRSAALFVEAYGPPLFRAMALASRAFFEHPPDGLAEHPLLTPRGFLAVTLVGEEAAMGDLLQSDPTMQVITVAEAVERVPILACETLSKAAYSEATWDIDTAALLSGFVRTARHNGARIAIDAEVTGIAKSGDDWMVETRAGRYSAPVIVNAAGAWADEIATLAGLPTLGLTPKRRTAIILAPPDGQDPTPWPVVENASETLYFKPDAGNILISPVDATPCQPSDAQPDELDVAIAVDRYQTITGQTIRRIEHSWAGLRTFAPDNGPVVGFDPKAEGFFWLAGQGGYGIQSSPAMAQSATALCLRQSLPDAILQAGISAETISPARFRESH